MQKKINLNSKNSTLEISYKRFIKEAIFNKTYFGFKSLLYFLYRYLFLLGFMDGKKGFIYHILQGFWYRFLVEAKVLEIESGIKNLKDKKTITLLISKKNRI